MPVIYVDADACPVKAQIEQVATRHQCQVVLVSNGGIRPSANSLISLVIVDSGPDEADKYIAEKAQSSDIVVTGDIPLAARCIDKGVLVIKHDGTILTKNNIGNVLATRDLMSDLRSFDPFLKGKNKPFSKFDRSKFLNSLEKLV